MHVAICSDGVFPAAMGGIEKHTRLLVESLARRHPDLRLTVIHSHPGRRFFDGIASVDERTVEPKPGKRQYLLECIDLSERFAAVLRTLPDAVVYSQGVCVLKGIREFSHRLIVNPHGLESFQAVGVRDWAATTPFRIVQKATFRHARFVVSLGGRLTGILSRQVRGERPRIAVIPNGVNLPSGLPTRQPRAGRPLRVLFVGRMARNKGVPDLLSAMKILDRSGEGSRYRLDVAGAGPLLERLRASCTLSQVRIRGKVTDDELESLYREADVLVLPTLFEGMPTVVLEAMARSLPVLVTDVGATRELVDDSNGRIIPKRDPGAVAGALRHVEGLDDAALARLGRAGRTRAAEEFSWERVADLHRALFDQLYAELAGR